MASHVSPEGFPPADVAAHWYYEDLGTHLTAESRYSVDPFPSPEVKASCEEQFSSAYPSVDRLLDAAVNNDCLPLQQALAHLIEVTRIKCA